MNICQTKTTQLLVQYMNTTIQKNRVEIYFYIFQH